MSIYPAFIISLDVELLWGFKLHPKAPKRGLLLKDEKKGRGTIDALLTLFEKYNIPSTWAFVGHLFLDHHKREGEIVPYCMPQPHWRCSSSRCTNSLEDPLFYYGRDIVEKIISGNIKHEIGYHSFSHVRFSECSREIAQIEIKEGVRIAKELGISFNSFVFPENKIGHRDILKENGFRIYRGPNFGGKNVNKSLPVRAINRSLCKIISPPTEPIWRETKVIRVFIFNGPPPGKFNTTL